MKPTAVNGGEKVIMGGGHNPGIDPNNLIGYSISLFTIHPSSGALNAYSFINAAFNVTSYSFITNMYLDAASYSIFFSTGVRAANYEEMPGREKFHCKVTFGSNYNSVVSSVCYTTTLVHNFRSDGFEMMYDSPT